LHVTNVTWEDTARSKNSSWGPNISDMTLVTEGRQLPVIRSPNYSDLTWDVPIEKIPLIVGNEIGSVKYAVDLKEYLKNFKSYLHKPSDWKGSKSSLYADRDSHVIMSAQSCFLPIPKGHEAKFNVALFNYQSQPDDPAILAIIATSKGTSAQVITNGGGWGSGQNLYFNDNGKKCSFLGIRISDERILSGKTDLKDIHKKEMSKEEKQDNLIMIIQVPLKQKKIHTPSFGGYGMMLDEEMLFSNVSTSSLTPPMQCMKEKKKESSNVEHAIVKVGDAEGEFTEIGGLEIERDPSFPVRVTLQFYKSTDNGVIDDENVKDISNQFSEAQKKGEYFGSLVLNEKSNRPTEHNQHIKYPLVIPPWWNNFWLTYKSNFPNLTEEKAKENAFKDGKFANSTMSEAEDKILLILGSISNPNSNKDKVNWDVL